MAKRTRRGFGAVRKLKSGRFQASYVSPTGKRLTAPMTYTAKIDADRFLNNVRYEIENRRWSNPSEVPISMEQLLFRDFAATHIRLQTTRLGETLRPSTKAHYRKLLRVNLVDFLDVPVGEIDKPMVDSWYIQAISEGKLTTASKAYKLLNSVMKRAVEDGLVDKSPCVVKGAQSAKTGRQISPPSPETVAMMVTNIAPRYRDLFLLSSYAGLRFGEASQLRVKDLVLSETGDTSWYSVNVKSAVTFVEGEFLLGKPKSAKGIRNVALTPAISVFLEKLLEARRPYGEDALLFPSAGGTFIRNDVFAKAIMRAKKKCGLEDLRITPHSLRHFGGTQFGAAGGNLAELKDWLGDSSSSAAIGYLHSTNKAIEVVKNMPVSLF